MQNKAEKALSNRISSFPQAKYLQGAIILSDISSGEIKAIVGDKMPNYVGFNRAIDAYRQTGSVIKPLVYLTALSRPQDFNLMTPIKDSHFSLTGSDGSLWQPENYDNKEHGNSHREIPLAQGLIHSYNLATAHLAINVGLEEVTQMISKLGFKRLIEAFPSIALGSKEMSPLEVLTLYQVIANQGLSIKPSVLIAVQDANGNLLTRYARRTEQLIEPEAAFLIRFLLSQVTQQGTAKSMNWRFPNKVLAGKTGTTNNLKDSWYAGFDNQQLAVVWLGRDDNQPMGLTGASGALTVWSELFKQLNVHSVDLTPPPGIEFAAQKGRFLGLFTHCNRAEEIPFYSSYLPAEFKSCD
ncbi:MAG: penicillin-binding transpeptidase domain-containing protein [Enterobacterales bacterium]|nr:penicillin-binding transpeptidase domain-containing protein [Enterobacterales bacterium]